MSQRILWNPSAPRMTSKTVRTQPSNNAGTERDSTYFDTTVAKRSNSPGRCTRGEIDFGPPPPLSQRDKNAAEQRCGSTAYQCPSHMAEQLHQELGAGFYRVRDPNRSYCLQCHRTITESDWSLAGGIAGIQGVGSGNDSALITSSNLEPSPNCWDQSSGYAGDEDSAQTVTSGRMCAVGTTLVSQSGTRLRRAPTVACSREIWANGSY